MSSTAADALSQAAAHDERARSTASKTHRRRAVWIIVGLMLTPVVAAATWPVQFDSREELFEIPKGTWARRMAGEKREILPSAIHLTVGVRDVFMLKNSDDVPQIFGPTLLMPGQTFKLPFTKPSQNYFACSAHASGQLLIEVEAAPTWPWTRLAWRTRRLGRWLSRS